MRYIFFLAILTAFFQYTPAQAQEFKCQCTGKSFDVRWLQADLVFSGRVTEIKDMSSKAFSTTSEDKPVRVTLTVDEVYKGTVDSKEKKVFLHTSLTQYTCTGYPFELDKTYLVFAYARKAFVSDSVSLYRFEEGTYDTGGLCGGTKPVRQAQEDLLAIARKMNEDAKNPKGLRKFLQ